VSDTTGVDSHSNARETPYFKHIFFTLAGDRQKTYPALLHLLIVRNYPFAEIGFSIQRQTNMGIDYT